MSNSILHIDFETRSTVNLKKTTTDVYARDPSTDVWCMAYAFDDEDINILPFYPCKTGMNPGMDDDMERIFTHIESRGLVYGHNVTFEWNIWNKILVPRYDWPGLKIEQCCCTMAMAYAMSLPGSLENAAAAVGLKQQKDMAGHRLMLKMAKPRKIHDDGSITWWDDPEQLQKLYAYCKQDVETERALHKRLRELSDTEQKLWFIDQRINERGVYIDANAAEQATQLAQLHKQKVNEEIHDVSDGFIGSFSYTNQLTDYVRMHGIATPGIAKADVAALLKQNLPDNVRRVLELRQSGAKTSTAKYDKMLSCISQDGRLRGMLQYHGAGPGRWAGRHVQLHNLPRPQIKQHEIEDILDNQLSDFDMLEILYGDVLDALSSCLRGVITAAPGNELSTLDYSNIEGRMLAWLAGEKWKLKAFADFDSGIGHDLYKVTAGAILGIDPSEVDSQQRQVLGKVPELALGYGGGVGAFSQMAKVYGVDMADHFDVIKKTLPAYTDDAMTAYKQRGKGSGIRVKAWVASEAVKLAWRERHPAITQYWSMLEQAAIAAVNNPTSVQKVRNVKFIKKGSFLFCQLPSKRLLCYPYPEIIMKPTPWGEDKPALQYKSVDQQTRKWGDTDTYGGKLAENITQAGARDILAEAIVRLDDAKYNVVLHVHDEVVDESPIGTVNLDDMAKIMTQWPVWANGLPVAVEGWQGKRYRK